MPKPTTALCFDYGLAQIGVAVGNSQLCSAQPLCALSATDGTPKWEQIETLITTWKPDILLVGEPKHMDGSESDMARRALKFARRLEGRFGLPIGLIDERLSSFEAKQNAKAEGHSGDYKKMPIDALAAALLLESYWGESTTTG